MLDKSFPFPADSLEAKAERQLLEAKAKAAEEALRRSPFHQELSSVAIELITRNPDMLVEDLQSKLDFLEGYLKKVSGKE
ncbi:hypothetical protein [Yersinia proxima]|uniref:hypothetical protein n=1 Tax=Yersinia proxima TaxID=2890316 RepID=UPI001D0FC3F4|nr:hypothetical protein [Yersinia proxima]